MTKQQDIIKPVVRATSMISFLQGITATALIPRVPDLINQLNLNFIQWGTMLGFIALASLLPLIFTNQLVLKYGTRRIITIGGMIFAGSPALIPWCTEPWMFAAISVIQTIAGAAFNIALQASAVMLQKRIKRTVMGAVHASWSIGATVSAALSGALVALISFKLQFGLISLIITAAMYITSRYLLDANNDGHLSEQKHVKKTSWLKTPAYVWLLTAGLFTGVWCEATMIDWSALFSKEVLGITVTQGAIAYTAFSGSMIIGRLSIGKVTKKIHIAEMAMIGAVLGLIGIIGGVLIGPSLIKENLVIGLVVLCFFWILAGLGSAPMVPTFFTAAGHVQGMTTAAALSRMSFMNTLIFLAGKSTMGAIANQNLQLAMLTPAITFVVVGIIAGIVVKTAKRKEKEMVEAFPMTGVMPVISTNDS